MYVPAPCLYAILSRRSCKDLILFGRAEKFIVELCAVLQFDMVHGMGNTVMGWDSHLL